MPNYSHGTKLALAAADEPPYLIVGTDVSAKYKGAFCEAKIIDVNKNVKVRVLFDGSSGNHLIDDTELKAGSPLEVGAKVEAKHPEKKLQTYIAATITKILDHSRYTVVFDDGDQCILRRSSICLKSGKHFAESETLDQLPLTNPEHFGNPVKVGQATAEQTSAQQNNNHNNNNNNINSSRGNQQAQNDKQSSSNLKIDKDSVGGKSNNKIVESDNNSIPTNGRAAAAQNNVKLEITDKPTSKTKTASSNSVTTNAVLNTPGRRGGKGRKARESIVNNSKLTDMADDPGDSSQDSTEADNGNPSVNDLIEVGVKLMVQYGKGKIQNVYEAKVNKIETNSAGKTRYFVHYTGWNNRYDEWVTKNRILSIVTDKENGVRDGRSRHSEATNTTQSSTAASSNSTSKESNSVKEKDVSTPAKGPRRSRLTEAAAAVSVPVSSTTVTPSTTATTTSATAATTTATHQVGPPTPVATPAKERDKSKDKSREIPTKTRRSRHVIDSSANSAATSSASSTSSVVSAAAPVAIKDEPKEKEAAPANAAPSKTGRPRQSEARESVSNSNLSSTNPTKDKDKEPPTKTRRSKLVEASAPNSTSATLNEAEVLSSPPRLANNQTERDKTRDSAKDTQRPATKEDRSEKQQQSELAPAVNSKPTTQINQSTNSSTKDKDTEKESASVQPTKSRGSRHSESSHTNASINSALSTTSTSSSGSSTTSSTTTTIATVALTVAASTAITSVTSTATVPSVSTAPAGVVSVASHPARDRERDKERDKEPPTKIRRSRQATIETSEKTTTSNVTTSATISTTATASSNSSAGAQVANPSTASSVSSSSSSSFSITFSNNVMSAYNLIEKERFSDLPIIDEPDCDKRISILQDKIMAIKQTYLALRSELADLDRRKKRPRLERSNSDHINFSGVTCRN